MAPSRFLTYLALFFLVGIGLAALTELLRIGWERAVEAEQAKDVLYRELRPSH